MVVADFTDEDISGAKGQEPRLCYDALLQETAGRELDLVAAGSVCRPGGSLQCRDTTTPAGRALFGMSANFAEFERSMICDRVVAGLNRTRANGSRLGRPPMPAERVEAMRIMLAA